MSSVPRVASGKVCGMRRVILSEVEGSRAASLEQCAVCCERRRTCDGPRGACHSGGLEKPIESIKMLVDPIAMLQGDGINSSSRQRSKARSADLKAATPRPQNEATSKCQRRTPSPFIYSLSSIVFRLNASQSARQSAAKSAAAVEGSS